MAQQTVELNNVSLGEANESFIVGQNKATKGLVRIDELQFFLNRGGVGDCDLETRRGDSYIFASKNSPPGINYAPMLTMGTESGRLQIAGGSIYNSLAFRGYGEGNWAPWRKIWHDGNLANPGSSQKFKLNIKAYKEDALGMINRMQVKQFDYKTKLDGWATPNAGNVGVVGFIMEDETTPEVIKVKRIEGEEYDQEGKVIKEGELVEHPDYYNAQTLQGLLIKAVQQLTAKVEELEAKLAER